MELVSSTAAGQAASAARNPRKKTRSFRESEWTMMTVKNGLETISGSGWIDLRGQPAGAGTLVRSKFDTGVTSMDRLIV
jgi:hypothetical protein